MAKSNCAATALKELYRTGALLSIKAALEQKKIDKKNRARGGRGGRGARGGIGYK